MIIIKNGEIQWCEILEIIQFDIDNDKITHETWYDYPLHDEVCILEIPKDSSKLKLYEVYRENLNFIPSILEDEHEFHDVFWNSNETYVFDCYNCAKVFISNYDGDFKSEVNELCESIAEDELVDETIWQFSNLDELDKEYDVDFLNELEELVYSKNISMNSVLTSMKMFMLDKYRQKIQEKRLSRLN